jgi:hypothetical protein
MSQHTEPSMLWVFIIAATPMLMFPALMGWLGDEPQAAAEYLAPGIAIVAVLAVLVLLAVLLV